jgi:type IV pilus assembly protein PilZ
MPRGKTIQIHYSEPGDFQGDFYRRGFVGLLFILTGRKFTLGDVLTVVVEFPSRRRSFRLRGRVVASRRGSKDPPLPAGIEVEFSSDQHKTLQMVLDCADGKSIDFIDRKSKRLLCSVEVSYRSDVGFVREFADDISEGGTFIRTLRKMAVGTELECKLKPPGYLLGIKLRCRVAWVSQTDSPRGMGVEFLFDSERQRKKVFRIVAKLNAAQKERLERGVRAFKTRSRSRPRGK